MKDSSVFESLPLVFTVEASGTPKPTVRWLHDGKEVKPDSRVRVINEGDLYKLEVVKAELGDAGKWQCEISNDLGKDVLQVEVSIKRKCLQNNQSFASDESFISIMFIILIYLQLRQLKHYRNVHKVVLQKFLLPLRQTLHT